MLNFIPLRNQGLFESFPVSALYRDPRGLNFVSAGRVVAASQAMAPVVAEIASIEANTVHLKALVS